MFINSFWNHIKCTRIEDLIKSNDLDIHKYAENEFDIETDDGLSKSNTMLHEYANHFIECLKLMNEEIFYKLNNDLKSEPDGLLKSGRGRINSSKQTYYYTSNDNPIINKHFFDQEALPDTIVSFIIEKNSDYNNRIVYMPDNIMTLRIHSNEFNSEIDLTTSSLIFLYIRSIFQQLVVTAYINLNNISTLVLNGPNAFGQQTQYFISNITGTNQLCFN